MLVSEAAVQLTLDWRGRVKHREPESLMFATWSGTDLVPKRQDAKRKKAKQHESYLGDLFFVFLRGRSAHASCGTDRLVPHCLQMQMSNLVARTDSVRGPDKQAGQTVISSHGSGGSCAMPTTTSALCPLPCR